ncbi:MAG TPA: hypothetical protein VEQ58_07205 [Polyangiaceae bacterium]|nr:hypothetical protein [Polyangiaceae bacterium]
MSRSQPWRVLRKLPRNVTLADRGYVLETGEIVLSGTGRDLLADDRIRAAYLGEELAS